ncbi:MAG: TonB-dependent receptor [Prolixibacteraceae bacterium]|nr:TonB-dependent receptor [Prolixibacteraceae bacterium]
MKIKIALWLSLIAPLYINGQEMKLLETDTTSATKTLEAVTVTAFRTPYNIFNIPAPVHLITPFQLETGNAFTPVEALNQIPGVLMHHGTLNTNRLTIRGIGSRSPYSTNKIKAYFGEIPLTSGDGETTLEDIENSSVKRVEIIKGPSSSLFGAGLAGVLLFHPKVVENDFIRKQFSVASFGTVKNTLSAGIAVNKLNIFALGAALKSNGYRENNSTKRANFLINTTYNLSANSDLHLLLKATKMNAFIPSSIDREMFENSPEKAAPNWLDSKGYEKYTNGQFGITYNLSTQKIDKFSVAAYGSFRDADEVRPFNHLFENSQFIGWRANLQKVINTKSAKFTFTGGMELFREKYSWSTKENESPNELLSDNNERRQYENLFFQMESNFFNRVFISTGINGNFTRFDYTDKYMENGNQSGNHTYKPVFSPRFGINVLANPHFSVFTNVSHGFSTPTFEETLLPEGSLNYDIKPETGWSSELGIRYNLLDRMQLTASYYRISIKNLLVSRRTGEDAYVGVNAGESVHPGLETEIRWNVLKPTLQQQLTIIGNATFANYHFTDFVDLENNYSGNNLPGTAKNTWLLMAILKTGENTVLTLWHQHTGKMPVNDANTVFSDAFGITNFEAKYSATFKNAVLEFKGGILNIFDIKYASMLAVNAPAFGENLPRYYYPGNPVNYYFSVTISLG